MFGGVQMARSRARRTACSNQLRQLALAAIQWSQDYEGDMPPYLSNLAEPGYMGDVDEVYVCPTDEFGGREGGVPPGWDNQFPECDDTLDNAGPTANLRNHNIAVCSYMYEFTENPIPSSSGYWAHPDGQTDTSGWSWERYKNLQAQYAGDDFVPMIRCWWHHYEKEQSDEANILNVSRGSGRVFLTTASGEGSWEEKAGIGGWPNVTPMH